MRCLKLMDQLGIREMDFDKEIRIGVIGAGYWGPNLIRNFVENTGSKVVVVADLSEDRLARVRNAYPTIRCTTNYQELFSMALDAVVIATPPSTHYEIAVEVLNQGLHAFIEKPITQRSDHAKALIDLAESRGLTLMVGHAFEFNVGVQRLKSMIDDGELGNIYYIDSARLNLGLYQQGTNVLWDLAPHDLSILCYILGKEPISVNAQGASCITKDIYDVIYMNLVFPDNILAHVHVSWLDPAKVRRVTVVGSKQMVIFNDIENDKIKIFDKGVCSPAEAGSFAEFRYSYRNGDILIPSIHFVEPLRMETQHFLDSIKNHTKPISDGEDGLRVVKILEAAERSLSNHSREESI